MKLKLKDINVGDKLKNKVRTVMVTAVSKDGAYVCSIWLDENTLNKQRYQLLKPKTKKVKKWVPKEEDFYYYTDVNYDLSISRMVYRKNPDNLTPQRLKINNCFQTEELALKALKKIKRVLRLSKHK